MRLLEQFRFQGHGSMLRLRMYGRAALGLVAEAQGSGTAGAGYKIGVAGEC